MKLFYCLIFIFVLSFKKADASIGMPIVPLLEKLKDYINNGIKLGRNKWSFQIHILKTYEETEIINAICNQMERGVLALFGETSMLSLDSLKSFVNTYNIPFFTWTYPNLNYVDFFDTKIDSETTVDSTDELTDSISSKPNEPPKEESNYLLNMHPSLTPLIISLLKYHRWETIYYIYDNDEALNRLQALFDYQMKETDFVTNIFARRVESTGDAIDFMKTLEDKYVYQDVPISDTIFSRNKITNEATFLIDFDKRDNYTKFFNRVRNMGVIRLKYYYVLITLGINEINLGNYRQDKMSIAGFSMVDYKNYKVVKQIGDTIQTSVPFNKIIPIPYKYVMAMDALLLFCESIGQIVGTDMTRLFDKEGVSLRRSEIYVGSKKGCSCTSEKNSTKPWLLGPIILNNTLKIENVEKATGFINFDTRGQRNNYTIFIYRTSDGLPLAKVGSYSTQFGFKIIEENLYREREGVSLTPFKNRKRIVVSIKDDPFFMIKTPVDGQNLTGNDRYEGYCVDLAERLAKILNISYELRLVKDNKFGSKDANGNWNGIIGEIVRQEADFAVAGLTISLVRERAVEFSTPFMNLGISIMVYKQPQSKPSLFSFMEPLSIQIWMCILLAYFGISLVLYFVSRISPYAWNVETDENGNETISHDFTMNNTLWFCLTAFLQQGIDILPRSISGRLVTSAWWLFTLIIISSYTANLAAFLTAKRMTSSIQSAEDLAKQTAIQYGTVESGTTKEFFRTSKFPTFQRMWSFMNGLGSAVFVKSNLEGIKKVRQSKGKYAFLLESSVNEYLNEREPCNTMKVGNNLDSKGYGVATPIGSDLKDAINLAVLQLREEGILEELKKKWWFDKSQCTDPNSDKSQQADVNDQALHLENVAGIFLILTVALVISIATAAIGILYKARIDSKKNKILFKEALRKKVRQSLSGYDENNDAEEEDEQNTGKSIEIKEFKWTLENASESK